MTETRRKFLAKIAALAGAGALSGSAGTTPVGVAQTEDYELLCANPSDTPLTMENLKKGVEELRFRGPRPGPYVCVGNPMGNDWLDREFKSDHYQTWLANTYRKEYECEWLKIHRTWCKFMVRR